MPGIGWFNGRINFRQENSRIRVFLLQYIQDYEYKTASKIHQPYPQSDGDHTSDSHPVGDWDGRSVRLPSWINAWMAAGLYIPAFNGLTEGRDPDFQKRRAFRILSIARSKDFWTNRTDRPNNRRGYCTGNPSQKLQLPILQQHRRTDSFRVSITMQRAFFLTQNIR